MKALLTLLVAALAVGCSHAPDKPLIRPQSILLIRHAEKPADATDTGLSAEGKKRADALPELFQKTAVRPDPLPTPDFIFAAKPSKHSRRPVETVTPLAKSLKLEVNEAYANDDYPPWPRSFTPTRSTTARRCWSAGTTGRYRSSRPCWVPRACRRSGRTRCSTEFGS